MAYISITEFDDKGKNPLKCGYETKKAGNCYVTTVYCESVYPIDRTTPKVSFDYRFTSEQLTKVIPRNVSTAFELVNLIKNAANRRDRLSHQINDHLKRNLSMDYTNRGNFGAAVDILKKNNGDALREMCMLDAFVTMMNTSRVKY